MVILFFPEGVSSKQVLAYRRPYYCISYCNSFVANFGLLIKEST